MVCIWLRPILKHSGGELVLYYRIMNINEFAIVLKSYTFNAMAYGLININKHMIPQHKQLRVTTGNHYIPLHLFQTVDPILLR